MAKRPKQLGSSQQFAVENLWRTKTGSCDAAIAVSAEEMALAPRAAKFFESLDQTSLQCACRRYQLGANEQRETLTNRNVSRSGVRVQDRIPSGS
jgi:hypothetical protein